MTPLHPIEASALHARRERVFLILAGVFLGSMTMLNILGVSRFIDLSFTVFGVQIPMALAVGVLPYPVTFLCTDFISELYGRALANAVVWVGLLLNVWVMLILWIGGIMPGFETIDPATGLPAADFGSMTVWAADALTADALSTGLFVLGPTAGIALANDLPDVEAIAIEFTPDGTVYVGTPFGKHDIRIGMPLPKLAAKFKLLVETG